MQAQRGHAAVATALLDAGSEVDTRNPHTGKTALSHAAFEGHVEVVKLLISKGADPRLVDKHGYSPLMLAAAKNHHDVIK